VTLSAEDRFERLVQRHGRQLDVTVVLAAKLRCEAFRNRQREEQAVEIAEILEL